MTTENGPNATGNRDNPGTTEGYVPFRIDTSKPAVDEERMTLFWIDDKEYTGPKVIPGGLAIRALDVTVRLGSAAGAWYCLTEAIGEEAITDLLECKQLTYPQAKEFLSQISAVYYGQAIGITGK